MDTALSLEIKNWRKTATFRSYLFSQWLVQQLSPVLLYFHKKKCNYFNMGHLIFGKIFKEESKTCRGFGQRDINIALRFKSVF